MQTQVVKTQDTKNQPAKGLTVGHSSTRPNFQFVDKRPEFIVQRKLQELANNHLRTGQMAQLQTLTKIYQKQQWPFIQQKAHTIPDESQHSKQWAKVKAKPAIQIKGKGNVDSKSLSLLSANSLTAQRIPDKNDLYWERLLSKAGNPPIGLALPNHLVNYITNPANVQAVGQNVANAVAAWHGGAPVVTMPNLRAAVNNGLNPTLAAPGNYANDTAHNALLTQELENNPFIQSVMDGTLQGAVPGRRNTAPGAGAIPAPAPGSDDRVLETVDLFNRLTNIPGGLPAVNVNPIMGPHAAMDENANMDLGWAAARGNILHEFGHHLENNLGPADFATLHNFLTARTQVPAGGLGAGAMAGMRDAGYFFENHPGYQIDMPQINAGGLAGRRRPQTRFQRLKHAIATPFEMAKQGIGRMYHATPLRYLGLIGSGLKQQFGRLASVITGRREPRNWGAKGVENFFVHNANNQQLSYSTAVHYFNNPIWYTGSTEYLSTTVEFFNRPSHIRELVRIDPLRVALFLYLGNRPQYNLVRAAFNAQFHPPMVPVDLNDLIHTAG